MYVLQLLYQLAFDQFLGQRDHPHGIKSAEEYIAAIGYCEYVPVGQMVRRVLQKDSHLLLAPWHPNLAACDKSNLPPQLRSLMRPHTLLADVCHEITPAMRSRLQPKIEAKEPDFFAYGNRFIIPFGDMYKFEAAEGPCTKQSREDHLILELISINSCAMRQLHVTALFHIKCVSIGFLGWSLWNQINN